MYDFALVTEPLTDEQMASIGWSGREGVADSGNQFHYYRLTKDNSILWGGYDTIYKFRGKARSHYDFNAETYATLAEHFLTTFPNWRASSSRTPGAALLTRALDSHPSGAPRSAAKPRT